MMWAARCVIVLSGVAALCGIGGFYIFGQLGNYNAATWALLSAVIATCCGHLHYLYVRRIIGRWHNQITMDGIKPFALVSAIVPFAFCIWYITMFLYEGTVDGKLHPCNNEYLVASIWALMTSIWGTGLFFTVGWYSSYLRNFETILPGIIIEEPGQIVEEAIDPIARFYNERTSLLAGITPPKYVPDNSDEFADLGQYHDEIVPTAPITIIRHHGDGIFMC